MEVYDLSEENEMDTYMSREVPVLEGDEAKSLTQEELGSNWRWEQLKMKLSPSKEDPSSDEEYQLLKNLLSIWAFG